MELLKRLFVAKAERVDTKQLELEFAEKLRKLEELAGSLGMGEDAASSDDEPAGKTPRKPSGRRDLRTLPLEEGRGPVLEQLVGDGKAMR